VIPASDLCLNAGRSDQGYVPFPARCTKTLKTKPTEYLKQLYCDSMVFTLGVAPSDRGGRRGPKTTPGLSDPERVAILGVTAASVLALKPA
jgi:hypothetical protein